MYIETNIVHTNKERQLQTKILVSPQVLSGSYFKKKFFGETFFSFWIFVV